MVTRDAGRKNTRFILGILDLVFRTCKTNAGTVCAVSVFIDIPLAFFFCSSIF